MKKISASQITLYSDCALKYHFRYNLRIDKPAESVHLTYGTAMHAALEEFNKNRSEPEDILQKFHDVWTDELFLTGLQNDFFAPKLYMMGINSLLLFLEKHCDYSPVKSEFRFEVDYNGNKLIGIIDAIIKQKNKIIIVDYKTAKEPYDKFKISTSVQLALYSYAVRKMIETKQIDIGKDEEDYIEYLVFLKDYDTLEGNIKINKCKISQLQIDRFHWIMSEFIKGSENGPFLPNYNSTCKYCEYKKECVAWKG